MASSGPTRESKAPPNAAASAAADRRLSRLATLLAVVAIAEAVAIIMMGSRSDSRFQIGLDLPTIGFTADIVLFSVVGALILQRRPRAAVAWLMIGVGVALGLGLVLFAYGSLGLPPFPGDQPARLWQPFAIEALLLSNLLFVPALGVGANARANPMIARRPSAVTWGRIPAFPAHRRRTLGAPSELAFVGRNR